MTDMAEVIATLEQASEGSPALDLEISDCLWHHVHGDEPTPLESGAAVVVQAYTASIDAALTLAPTGFIEMRRYSDGWYVKVIQSREHPAEHLGTQKPAALALCIAALKARNTRTQEGNDV